MSSTHRHNRITIKTPSDPVMLTSGRFSAQQHVKFRLHVFNNRPSASCTDSVPGLARFSDLNIFDENLMKIWSHNAHREKNQTKQKKKKNGVDMKQWWAGTGISEQEREEPDSGLYAGSSRRISCCDPGSKLWPCFMTVGSLSSLAELRQHLRRQQQLVVTSKWIIYGFDVA